jgi:CheY-like chemotaxis protein
MVTCINRKNEKQHKMKLKPILLAEDNPFDIEMTLKTLTECNIANPIEVVNDGVEALEFLRYQGKYNTREKIKPVVVLLDLKMPRMDGIEVLEKLRKDSDLKMIPVVIFTSSKEENDLIKSYLLGVNAYVVKPIDCNQFATAVRQIGIFWAMINENPPQ